jgi:hypothetical protein
LQSRRATPQFLVSTQLSIRVAATFRTGLKLSGRPARYFHSKGSQSAVRPATIEGRFDRTLPA